MPPKAKKEVIDPEVLMRKKFKAKCRFRALGRLVLANVYWLIEGVDEYEGIDDVKRRVQQAVRSKKKKQLLNINDKALLNKPADERTDHEKKYIYRIIGGLKCFKRYPNHVKKKLAAVTYFRYYSPGRVIVRQHQDAHALYFIANGDVVVSQMVFDELLQQDVSVEIGVMHSGDMFGEVSLLHNINRTATVTTLGHCELLALMKEDFKNVLQASIQAQWDEVRLAMSAFTYFDALDEVALREGCIVAKMKSYEINETMLGDGQGVANYVYFILSGRCQMIESMQVIINTRLGKNFYTLYDPYVPEEESEQDLDVKYFDAYKNKKSDSHTSSEENPDLAKQDSPRSTNSILKPKNSSVQYSSKHVRRDSAASNVASVPSATTGVSEAPMSLERPSLIHREQSQSIKSQVILPPSEVKRDSMRLSVIPEVPPKPPKPPENLKTFFMQVVQFNPGSSFGLGENMRDRRIVAITHVDCILMPKMWLLQRNSANIWTRIQHYLEKKIPTKKQLFKEFVQDRRWHEFREQLVEDVIARSNTVNWTSVHDVPYSIRMEEMLEL